ncbi:MAG: hypothetical protein J6Y93_04205 [Treponema sp.]|nr:hypothetical protein [Treponema sp.]
MNSEKCQKVMDSFLELDKNERMPLSMTMHMLVCKNCRRQVHYLTEAERIAARPLKVTSPLSDDELKGIMKEVSPEWSDKFFKKNPVSMFRWILGGILMVLFLSCFGIFSSWIQSESLLISYYVVFAAIIVSYCAVFVGSNLDFFVKKIETFRQ